MIALRRRSAHGSGGSPSLPPTTSLTATPARLSKYYYLLLPSGNSNDWPRFKYWIHKLGLKVEWASFKKFDSGRSSGSRAYRITLKEHAKLPMSAIPGEGRYLPVSEEDGFGMYRESDDFINQKVTDNRWRQV